MTYIEEYKKWLNNPELDEKIHKELLEIEGNDQEIRDRFYQTMAFGTAGLRGKLGAGTNRMNTYMVGKAAQALANTIKDHGPKAISKGIVVCYDIRHQSKEFAELTCSIMAANGIHSFLYKGVRPTPMCSFAIRELSCISGVMVTASHNPQAYNGYKAYWQEGSQILNDIADQIANHMSKITEPHLIQKMNFSKAMAENLITYVPDDVEKSYYQAVLGLTINDDNIDKNIKVVYTPLNGVGNLPVRHVLKERGFNNIIVVPEQEQPDPDFTTIGYPNPEVPKTFHYAEKLGQDEAADILIANDPDSDRVALEVKRKDGTYQYINGNQIGALLAYYIFSQRQIKKTLPDNPVLVKSIVTSDFASKIASYFGVETVETLTGFKNICGKANEFDISKGKSYVLGFEESIGYCYGTFVRDKDGVSAAMMVVEMAAYFKAKGKSLIDVLEELYMKFGFFGEMQYSLELEGSEGQEKIGKIMSQFRKDPITKMGNISLLKVIDFEKGYLDLPKQNCLKFYFIDGSWFAMRPSGTEPKLKFYFYSLAKSHKESQEKLELMKAICLSKMDF